MKNIFSQTKDYVNPPKRNVFDLSFQNNGTYNFGTLYPVFCKEVIPGDSFKIDTTFALRFLPMAFPVQTKMTANIHFFYVRNRNLWQNWTKFIGHTDNDVVPPYIARPASDFATGSIYDYLGVPTTSVGNYQTSQYFDVDHLLTVSQVGTASQFQSFYTPYLYLTEELPTRSDLGKTFENLVEPTGGPDDFVTLNNKKSRLIGTMNGVSSFSNPLTETFTFTFSKAFPNYNPNNTFSLLIFKFDKGINTLIAYADISHSGLVEGSETLRFVFNTPLNGWNFGNIQQPMDFPGLTDLRSFLNGQLNGSPYNFAIVEKTSQSLVNLNAFMFNIGETPDGTSVAGYNKLISLSVETSFTQDSNVTDLSDLPPTFNPFYNLQNRPAIALSALPFRAYESIYNAFYRNEQNDPLFVDGKPVYDIYCPENEDGADDYPYKLYQRNWELDYLTSAVQSPQQGIAPLVGVSHQGDFTFVHKDSNGNVGYFTAKANLSSNGNSITGFQLSDKVTLQGLPSTPDVSDVPDELKRGTIYSLNQMALAGISINDFRNVNALQRWLETNIRRGYKYRDQIKSHFGVDVRYDELNMPEFIGGVSEPIFINQVNQTTETESDPLGSYAGQASVLANSSHSIKHYCDEHGFIIGILSIVPVPNYSQLLPKHFIKHNYLDYFFPEFGHIGMQPIDYREVAPLQVYSVDPTKINNTFGYQRAWHDYIASVDEVHGLFRTNLRNFVLNRQFDSMPKLNHDFLVVDPEQLNDVFTVQDLSDKIMGQIKFDVIAKRPIPKYGIPRLE